MSNICALKPDVDGQKASEMKIVSVDEMNEGLFGQVILWTFEILPILEQSNVDISLLNWEISTSNYGNIFPDVLLPNTNHVVSHSAQVVRLMDLRSQKPQYVLGDDFSRLRDLFFKYFRIPAELNSIACQLNLNESLGVHFRGSDKTTDTGMNTPITKKEFLIILHEYIRVNKVTSVFLATDENDVFDMLRKQHPAIHLKSARDFTGNLFWRQNADVHINARDAMIDMLCLSKCKEVLKVSSALSAFAKVINPDLKMWRLNAMKMMSIPYFPDAYIPTLRTNADFSEECNSVIDRVQQDDWQTQYGDAYCNFYFKER